MQLQWQWQHSVLRKGSSAMKTLKTIKPGGSKTVSIPVVCRRGWSKAVIRPTPIAPPFMHSSLARILLPSTRPCSCRTSLVL